MIKISAVVLTFNEEKNIIRCLESVSWADEILVVDSFSTDSTIELSKNYTSQIIQNEWPGYIEQKNFAVENAKYDWIFSIDADEEVSPQLRDEILRVKSEGPRADGYKMPRKVFYLEKWINHSGWYPDLKIRLFDRRKGKWGGVNPHDKVILSGSCGRFDGDLFHYTYENIFAHVHQLNRFSTIAAEAMLEKGRKPSLFKILFNPPGNFFTAYILRRGFLDGMAGFLISAMIGYHAFLKYFKLWELYRQKKMSE